MSRWTEDTTIKFVQEYLRHDCLWNFKNKNYRNKFAKQRAFCDIAESMAIANFGGRDVYLKIKSIRSTYSQELKKIKDSKKSGASADQIYKPNMKWFKMLNHALKSASASATEATEFNGESGDANHREIHNQTKGKETSLRQTTFNAGQKRRLCENDVPTENENSTVKTAKESTTAAGNEFDIFGQSVASQLNAMPLILALQAQQHIQNYLCQLRIQHITNYGWIPSSFNTTTRDIPSPALTYYEDYETPSPSPSWTQMPDTPSESYIDIDSPHLSEAQGSSVSDLKSEFLPLSVSTVMSILPTQSTNSTKKPNINMSNLKD